jgi:hypothetical protein
MQWPAAMSASFCLHPEPDPAANHFFLFIEENLNSADRVCNSPSSREGQGSIGGGSDVYFSDSQQPHAGK